MGQSPFTESFWFLYYFEPFLTSVNETGTSTSLMLVRGLPDGVDARVTHFLDQNVGKSIVSNGAGEEGRSVLAHHPLTNTEGIQRTTAGDELDGHLLNEFFIETKVSFVSKDGVVRLKAISVKSDVLRMF